MRRGYEIIDEGRKDADTFASWGAHYIRFGLDYPHIYDLMFGNIDLDMSLYPDLEALHDAAFDEVYLALKPFMIAVAPKYKTKPRIGITKPKKIIFSTN